MRKPQDFYTPVSEQGEIEIMQPAISAVVVIVNEEVEVELTSLEARHGAVNPRVDLDAVTLVEDEREAEGSDGRVGANNESAIDEIGEELGVGGLRVGGEREEVVGEVQGGNK